MPTVKLYQLYHYNHFNIQGTVWNVSFHSLFPLLLRSEWPFCHSGALSSPPIPYGQESTHTSETEDTASSVWRTLLLVSTVSPLFLFLFVHTQGWFVFSCQPCQSWTVPTQVCLFDLHCDGLWLAFHQRLRRWSRGSSQRLLLARETECLTSRQERPACHSPPVSQ